MSPEQNHWQHIATGLPVLKAMIDGKIEALEKAIAREMTLEEIPEARGVIKGLESLLVDIQQYTSPRTKT